MARFRVSFEADIDVDAWAEAYRFTTAKALTDIIRELQIPETWVAAIPLDESPAPVVTNVQVELVVPL